MLATASPSGFIEQMDATTLVLPGMIARVEPYLNSIFGGSMNDAGAGAIGIDPITVEVIGSALVLDYRRDGRGADPRVLFHQHQGTPRLLHGAVRHSWQHAVPGRAHPDASRQLHRPDPAYPEASSDRADAAWRRVLRQRRLRGWRHASARHRPRGTDLRRWPHHRVRQ